MDINEVTQGEYLSKKYKLSWVAYVEMILAHIIFIAIVVFCSSFFSHQTIILSCFFVFEAIFIFLVVLSKKAKYVFIDERGVWYHRGILPWTKGVNGILWHDCGGSSYKQGFFAYIFNTYTIYITHKYTESMQIAVHHIYNGKEFCGVVSDYLHKLHNN